MVCDLASPAYDQKFSEIQMAAALEANAKA
jgi:hypothetical protein